ncbi:MAG TPA: hypothetical protein VHV29_15830 [Terriglobales bacterium]|jgi:hypothetical protein|nr:hypothetical protein [Terriglobales bacterium]
MLNTVLVVHSKVGILPLAAAIQSKMVIGGEIPKGGWLIVHIERNFLSVRILADPPPHATAEIHPELSPLVENKDKRHHRGTIGVIASSAPPIESYSISNFQTGLPPSE